MREVGARGDYGSVLVGFNNGHFALSNSRRCFVEVERSQFHLTHFSSHPIIKHDPIVNHGSLTLARD